MCPIPRRGSAQHKLPVILRQNCSHLVPTWSHINLCRRPALLLATFSWSCLDSQSLLQTERLRVYKHLFSQCSLSLQPVRLAQIKSPHILNSQLKKLGFFCLIWTRKWGSLSSWIHSTICCTSSLLFLAAAATCQMGSRGKSVSFFRM